MEKRKSLIPYLKKARDADVKAVLIKDKLFIGGVLYSGGPLDVAIANAKKEKKNLVIQKMFYIKVKIMMVPMS